jgi:hypothetical protein
VKWTESEDANQFEEGTDEERKLGIGNGWRKKVLSWNGIECDALLECTFTLSSITHWKSPV